MKTKTSIVNTNKDVSVLEKYIQVVPSELLDALKEAAVEKGISLDMEVALRLTVHMTESDLASDNALSQRILKHKFVEKEAKAECKRNHLMSQYLYEIEKLRLFLNFEGKLPRNVKETFAVIDVKEETKRIKAEMAAEEKKANRDNDNKQGE